VEGIINQRFVDFWSNMKQVNHPNQYRKQLVRLEIPTASEIEALKKEVQELTLENKKLQDELIAREELMQNLFSFIADNQHLQENN
jgi:hypothetical protein